jgi:hypothetical protein
LSNIILHLTTNTITSNFSGDISISKSVAVLCKVNTPLCKLHCLAQKKKKKKKELPFTVKGDTYSFDTAESQHDNQIAQSPTNFREGGFNKKTRFVIKKEILVSNYNIQYQIMNSIPIYSIVPRKSSLNTHFLLCLLFSPAGVSLIRLQH